MKRRNAGYLLFVTVADGMVLSPASDRVNTVTRAKRTTSSRKFLLGDEFIQVPFGPEILQPNLAPIAVGVASSFR